VFILRVAVGGPDARVALLTEEVDVDASGREGATAAANSRFIVACRSSAVGSVHIEFACVT
jgi:hypothetical protein